MKRRIFGFVFAVLFVLSCTCSAWAETSKNITIDDLDISLQAPTDVYVLKRDMDSHDRSLKDLDLTSDEADDILESKSAYLDIYDDLGVWEILLTAKTTDYKDFDQMDNDSIEEVFDLVVVSSTTKSGMILESSEIYETDSTSFIKTVASQREENRTYKTVRYVTAYHGYEISITGKSYGSNEYWITRLQNIVDSISLLNATAEKKIEAKDSDAEPVDYEDDYASFTLPARWEEKPLSKEYITLKNKFMLKDGTFILYGCEDIWEEMSAIERIGKTRKNIDNSVFTKGDVAAAFDIDKIDIDKTTYGKIDYYVAPVGDDQTIAVHVENGYMYYFRFSGTDENQYYSDFESMLESVEFVAQGENKSEKTSGGTLSGKEIAIIACIGAVIIAVILIAFWYVGTAKENKKVGTNTMAEIKKDCTGTEYAMRYCHRCGYRFGTTVDKCPQCGATIPRIEMIMKQ